MTPFTVNNIIQDRQYQVQQPSAGENVQSKTDSPFLSQYLAEELIGTPVSVDTPQMFSTPPPNQTPIYLGSDTRSESTDGLFTGSYDEQLFNENGQ
jgi:hypothetical protein